MSFKLTVATYNIFMRPDNILFRDGQRARRKRLVPRLHELEADVLILNEAFDDSIRKKLLTKLFPSYPFQTDVVGRDRRLRQDGGVVLLSRHKILQEEQIVFKVAEGSDRWADKGCIYAKVRTANGTCHVLGTHLDAGRDGTVARRKQLRKIRAFIDDLNLSKKEPVIVAGDLNMGPKQRPVEFKQMKEILRACVPKRTGHSHSYDPSTNILAGGAKRHLDHVLYLSDHATPSAHENRVIKMKAKKSWSDRKHKKNKDLSDHYPVLGTFKW